MIVIRPGAEYLQRTCDLFTLYAEEAAQARNRKLNPANVIKLCQLYFTHPQARAFIAVEEEKVIAMIFGDAHDFVFDEMDGSINIHYLHPDWRMTYTGGLAAKYTLKNMLHEMINVMGLGDIYTCAESGMSEKNNKVFENLYRKEGFEYAGGRTLIRYRGNYGAR